MHGTDARQGWSPNPAVFLFPAVGILIDRSMVFYRRSVHDQGMETDTIRTGRTARSICHNLQVSDSGGIPVPKYAGV